MRVNGHDLSRRVGRLYPKITRYRFAYQEAADVRRKVQRIKVYFLLFSPKRGHGIDDFIFYLRKGLKPSEWSRYLRDHGIAAYSARWIPSVNEHRGKDWTVRKVLCFHAFLRKSGRREGTNV